MQDLSSVTIPPLLLVSANRSTTDHAFEEIYELKKIVQYGVRLYQFHNGSFAAIASGNRYEKLQVGESG